jgi:hypothetical protein
LELAKAAAAKSLGQLQVKEEGKAQDNSAGSSKRPREERRRRNRGNKREEAFAVTAAPANGKSGFKGKCYTCGQEGHVKADCFHKPKAGATSGRKPGAVSNFCHKRDSHTEDECREKHPKKKPEKWRKKDGGGAKQAYAAGAEPSAPEAEPAWDPYMAWGVPVQKGGGALDAFAIFTEEGPDLRATTQEQQDTTAAARAKGEAARAATRAKEEGGRVGGPPPGFKPKGKRAPAAAEDAGQPASAGRRRQAPKAAAASPARAIRIPPGFGEYGPNDPRFQGLTDAEQVGVRVELLDPPKPGPVTGDVVRRRGENPVVALLAFHADVLLAEEARPREVQREARVAGLPAYPRRKTWEGSMCWIGRPNGKNGASTPASKIMRASLTPPSKSGKSHRRRWTIPAIASRSGLATLSSSKARCTSVTFSLRWTGAGGRGGAPTMRAMQRERASCQKGPTGDKGRGPTSTSSSVRASYAIWGENGWQHTATSPTKKPGNQGSRRTRGPTGSRRCNSSSLTWGPTTPGCQTSLISGKPGRSMSAWYCPRAKEAATRSPENSR